MVNQEMTTTINTHQCADPQPLPLSLIDDHRGTRPSCGEGGGSLPECTPACIEGAKELIGFHSGPHQDRVVVRVGTRRWWWYADHIHLGKGLVHACGDCVLATQETGAVHPSHNLR